MDYSSVSIRILLALVLGGSIGLERQFKHRPAGFKTHILVCVGAAAVMVLSEYLFFKYYTLYGLLADPARLGAQVISGVGFLGAGTIIHHGQNVRGLTTAASLWVVAAIGLAAGAGFYLLAVIVTISIYIVLFIFNRLYNRLSYRSDVVMLTVRLKNKPKAIGAVSLLLARYHVKILEMDFQGSADGSGPEDEPVSLRMSLILEPDLSSYYLMEQIRRLNDVIEAGIDAD